jgi:MFS family permease
VSSILGACTLAFGLAGLIAPWLGGYVFDLYKSYHPVFYLTVVLSAVCVFFVYYTRKTQKMISGEREASPSINQP